MVIHRQPYVGASILIELQRMQNTYSLFRSKTFYTIVAMFIVGGLNAIMHVLPDNAQLILEAILGVVASTFHLDTATKFGASN